MYGDLKGPKIKQVKDENPRNWALIMCGSPERAQKQASEGQMKSKLSQLLSWKILWFSTGKSGF